MRIPEFAVRFHRRIAAVLLLGVTGTGCNPEAAGTAPDVITSFAKAAVQRPVAAVFTFPTAGSSLTGDTQGDYIDGVCGVGAVVFYLAPDYLDGNMQLGNPRLKDRTCIVRTLTFTYPDGGAVESNSVSMNIRNMGTVLTAGERSMNIAIAGTSARCKRLGFGNALGGTQVIVTRTSPTAWRVATQDGGSAACERQDGLIETINGFSIDFTVTLR